MLQSPEWREFYLRTIRRWQSEAETRLQNLKRQAERLEPVTPEAMIDLTQGHPALLQSLCREIVNIANRDNRKNMTAMDVAAAVDVVMDRNPEPMVIFWRQFCEDAERKTVEDILAGRPPADQPSLARLQEHEFVVSEYGAWRIRVPLFEQWLRGHRHKYPVR